MSYQTFFNTYHQFYDVYDVMPNNIPRVLETNQLQIVQKSL